MCGKFLLANEAQIWKIGHPCSSSDEETDENLEFSSLVELEFFRLTNFTIQSHAVSIDAGRETGKAIAL